ncbi:MAG: leucine-rich repeat protein, partial [Ruminococcus sp.]|nr:leucine-rich repeat protein [Ruminococcus sp.]
YFCDANADYENTVRYGCSISKSELRTKVSNMLTHSGADTTGWVAHFQDGISNASSETYANIGDDFYAGIFNTACGKPITHVDNTCHVYLDKETNTVNQVWRFQRQSDGAYVISSCRDGKALEEYFGKTDSGNNVSVCSEFWGGNYQQWYLIPQGNGYVFLSKHFTNLNRVMDLNGGDSSDGTVIQVWERNNTDAQIWSVYAGPEIQLKPTNLTVTAGTSSAATSFKWDTKYGVARYDLKIWENHVDKNISPYVTKSYEGAWSNSADIDLPAGTYEAYITTNNYYQSFESNYVKFTVTDDTAQKLPDGADPNDYEIVTEYRSRDKSTTTSASASLDGWIKYDTKITGWTNWSAWQNNSITASESREVKTQYVNPTYKTVWHYSRDTGNGYSTYAIGYYGNPEYITLDYRLTAKGTIDGYTRYGSYGNYLTDYWWNESSESVVDRAGYTQYSYRDAVYMHYFYKWSEWSEWSETPIDTTENNDVEIRKVYRLKEHVGINKPLVGDYSYEVISESPKTCVITGYNGEGTDITIPNKIYGYTVTSIRYLAFMKCTSLTSVTIPDSVTSIGNSAFRGCTSLTSITIPNSVTSIGDGAFYGCTSLANITISNSVSDIGMSAFSGCDSLTIYGYNNSYVQTYAQENDIPFNALGDANDDGIIDANDYAMVRSCAMCTQNMTEEQKIAADYNRDGVVDAFDVIAIDVYIHTK